MEEKKKEINWKKVGVVVGIIVLIIIALLMFKSCGNEGTLDDNGKPTFDLSADGNVKDGDIEGKSKEEIEAELNKKVADGMINISMNTNPTFENGKAEGNVLIVNEDINKYPQVVEIYRDDTNELIYKSGGIPVGSHIEYAKLDVDLDAGTYDCTAYFNAVNPETNELVGKAGAKIQIIVLN